MYWTMSTLLCEGTPGTLTTSAPSPNSRSVARTRSQDRSVNIRSQECQASTTESGIVNLSQRRLLRLLLLVGVSLSASCFARTATAKVDPRSAKADELVRADMGKSHIPGLVLAIVKDGKVSKYQSYGMADVASKTPATMDTVFALASGSKPFVATAIMMLVEEGKLRLSDPISKYLDGTPDAWKKITVRHLLSMTSGIPDFLNENIQVDTLPDRFDQNVLDALAKCPLHFSPGGDWSYSNSNYHLLGMIIRKVTGKSYGSFLHDRIFVPLGMTHTAVYPISGSVPKLATGYCCDNDQLHPAEAVAPAFRAFAGGGLLSTVGDMIKWDAALRTGKLLRKSVLQEMWAPGRLNDWTACKYGLGWFTKRQLGRLVVGHEGNYIGYSSAICRCVDSDITVIILDNQFRSTPLALAEKIAVIYGQPDYHPILDKDPLITAHVHDVIDRATSGNWRAEDFTATAWAKWSSAQEPIKQTVQQKMADMGRIRSMVLLERTQKAGDRIFRYRIEFEKMTMDAIVHLDKQGRVVVLNIGT